MASTFKILQLKIEELTIIVSADDINIYSAFSTITVESNITINLIVIADDTSKPRDEHGAYPEVEIPATLTILKGDNHASDTLANTQLQIVHINIIDWSPTEDEHYIYNVI